MTSIQSTTRRVFFVAALLVSLAATGCGGGGDSDSSCLSYTVSNTEPFVGSSGLTLAPSQGAYMSFRQMEELYQEVQQCMGVHPAAGPTVYYKNFSQNNLGAAWAFQTSTVIWVNIDQANLVAPRNCHSDRQALKHEFVHYLLWASGTNIVANAGHDSPYFAACGAVGVRTENGVPY